MADDHGQPDAADPVQEWRESYRRVRELVLAADAETMAATVPACPDWTARELLAHVVGLDHDVLAGSEPEDHDPAWTQSHVDARAGASLQEVVAEWDADAAEVERYLGETDPRPLNDMVIHEQDLRGALGAPGARDTPGLRRVRDVMAGRLADALPDDLAPLRLESPTWSWTSGDGEPGVVLRAGDFDLFRALTSRRTADEVRDWAVAGDVEPYLEHLALLGPLPDRSLGEPAGE